MTTRDWSTTAASNNAAPPNGWPEGQLPSSVNNVGRQMMADIRSTLEALPFFDFGHNPTRIDNDTFTVATDLTATYVAGRRVKLVGATTGYATIASSSYSAPDTTVNVTMDSGNVPTSLLTVSLSFDSNARTIPRFEMTEAEIAESVSISDFSKQPGDVLRYGALLDGSDNTAAIAAAIAQEARYLGVPIDIPRDALRVNSTPLAAYFSTTSYLETAIRHAHVLPEWWGAQVGDDTPAQQAINVTALKAALDSRMAVQLPAGRLYINALVQSDSAIFVPRISGMGALQSSIVQTNASVGALDLQMVYQFRAENFGIYGGTTGLKINNGSADGTMLELNNLRVRDQTVIGVDNRCTSALLKVNGGYYRPTTGVCIDSYCDYTDIIEAWIGANNADGPAIIFRVNGRMRDCIGVPYGATTSVDACWVRALAGVELTANRFGPESGNGRTILESHGDSSLTTVKIEGNYSPTPIDVALIKFYSLPRNFTLRDNFGFNSQGGNGTAGIWVDPAAEIDQALRGSWDIRDLEMRFNDDGVGSSALQALIAVKQLNTQRPLPSHPRFVDLAYSNLATVFATTSSPDGLTNCTSSDAVAYDYLGGPNSREVTATADNAFYSVRTSVATATTAPDVYTWVLDCVVTGTVAPIQCTLDMENNQKHWWLMNGTHVLCMHGYPDDTVNTTRFAFKDFSNGVVIRVGRLRVFKGAWNITTVHTVYSDDSGAATPSSSSKLLSLGDTLEYTNPTAGGFRGKVVTTAGTTGAVLETFGAITA